MRPATDWLFSLQRFGIEPGLERVRRLLDDLGRPQSAFRTVLVGGTNGKGATAGALTECLETAGRATALFTSPHLTRPNERIVRDGAAIGADEFEALAARVRPAAEATGATFFEVITAMACLAFADREGRTAVFEVGLGGRFDATNVLDPILSIVTNVELDHTAILGDTPAEIAAEKAGILRSGRPAWTAARGEALAVLRSEARRIGARLSHLGTDAEVTVRSLAMDGIEVDVMRGEERMRGPSPLIGTHQGGNLALAALAARDLGVDPDAVRRGLAAFTWPGRLERVDGSAAGVQARVLLDGAHNPAAAAALARALGELPLRPHLVLGTSSDKDALGVLTRLAPAVTSVRTTRAASSPRAQDPRVLEGHLRSLGVEAAGAHDDAREAVRAAAADAVADGSAVLVAGSLYLVGEVRPWLLGEEASPYERWQ